MPCQLPEEINNITDDVYSYMCNLAMEKCSKKTEKKKASCGGAAMRKRLLIKNFVAQMLAQERETRDQELLRPSNARQSLVRTCSSASSFSSTIDGNDDGIADQSIESEEEDEEQDEDAFGESKQDTSMLVVEEDEADEDDDGEKSENVDENVEDEQEEEQQHREQERDHEAETDEDEEAEAAAASILGQQQIKGSDTTTTQFLRQQQNNQQPQFGGWRTSAHLQQQNYEYDFHKVPVHNQFIHEDNLNIFYSDRESKAEWRFYGLDDVTTTTYGYEKEANFVTLTANNNIMIMEDEENKLELSADVDENNAAKLFILDSSEEHQPLVGLVNMVPPGLKFNFDSMESSAHQMMLLDDDYRQYHQEQPHPHCLIELDNVKLLEDDSDDHHTNLLLLDDGDDTTSLVGRKRPWSMVFDKHEQMMMMMEMGGDELGMQMAQQQHSNNNAANLSPLCCGLLQQQPFGGAGAETTAVGAGMTPMVKRLKL